MCVIRLLFKELLVWWNKSHLWHLSGRAALLAPFRNALRTGGLSQLVIPRLAGDSREWEQPQGPWEAGLLVDPALTSMELFFKSVRERVHFKPLFHQGIPRGKEGRGGKWRVGRGIYTGPEASRGGELPQRARRTSCLVPSPFKLFKSSK